MRQHLVLYVNGRRLEVAGADAFSTLADYVRTSLRLTGTKVVCAEGDCGSCSVLVGRMENGKLVYRAVDSCIQLLFQLDGTHVISVEGLSREGKLSPVQQAMVTRHGSQCGYCTPGFVVAMTGLLESQPELDSEGWRCGLAGNLCRCTGYASILEAGQQAVVQAHQPLAEQYPHDNIAAEFHQLQLEAFEIQAAARRVFSPVTTQEAVEFLTANPSAKIVAGATDVGVQMNKRVISPTIFLDLNRIDTLREVRFEGPDTDGSTNKVLCCGAGARWVDLEPICREHSPEFAEIVSVFGSPQIRHVGTIGGNIVNASPIADSLPFLFVTEAQLEITGPQQTRTVNINEFYHGYRQTDLKPGELLTGVRIPLPGPNQSLSLYKVSRRRDLDIASFTAAILLEVVNGEIADARIALGAVGPTVIRARKTEAYLRGKPFSEAVMQGAGELAVNEISPISDVRGTADFRWQLTRNVFLKYYLERMRSAQKSA
ncbi:xanthine dehydrogenase small subunit [Anatilimnocola sp. NA78]|uniref:xanthine dehydrogenase small subunit n=1 Tax=Anatilimnocola sp. NA78 TaxID=3415683 RepID=UPI003CE47468